VAFVLTQSSSYSWPVSFDVPVDGGRHEKQTFDAELKRLPQSRIIEIQEAVQKRLGAIQRDEETDEMITDQEIAGEILIGWSGVNDEDANPIPFSEKSKAQLLDVPTVTAAIVTAYFNSLSGAKRKN
jgi:hypothetical protein